VKKKIGQALLILVAALCCVGLYRMHLEKKAGFVLEKHLEDTLIELGKDGEEKETVTLRDALYYILLVENASSERAEKYSDSAKKSFWNIKTGDEGYVSQVAKKVIINQIIRDELLYREAIENGWELDETQIENATIEVWAEMSDYQKELTGYTKESLKERMAKAYAGQTYSEAYGDDFDELKETYHVKTNDTLWAKVEMGATTLEADKTEDDTKNSDSNEEKGESKNDDTRTKEGDDK
jgi:hypothetical protein